MKKVLALAICCILAFSCLCSCSKNEELLSSPFVMEAYETYMNGANIKNVPSKVFNTPELFNALNAADADSPFDVTNEATVYNIDMVNGNNYSKFTIWNNGKVQLLYNAIMGSEFYLTPEQYIKVINILEE